MNIVNTGRDGVEREERHALRPRRTFRGTCLRQDAPIARLALTPELALSPIPTTPGPMATDDEAASPPPLVPLPV